MNIKDSNIAIVHDWFLQKSFGGSEKVTFTLNNFLNEKYSNPDIFSLTSNIESSKIKSFQEKQNTNKFYSIITIRQNKCSKLSSFPSLCNRTIRPKKI